MWSRNDRSAVLVVTHDPAFADRMLRDLRSLQWVAVAIDNCDIALEMMETVEFAVIIVDLVNVDGWSTCGRVVRSGRSPVVVVTQFLASDSRYRRTAFDMGVAAYLRKPCSIEPLRELFERLERGDGAVEIVA
jgi:DNA-binding response OmpR family regulator